VYRETWTHVTPSRGFPTWQVRCLAFHADGTLIVGTQTDGLLVAKRDGKDYLKFTTIEGAKHLTVRPRGDGLPSGPINEVPVDRAGRWFVATDRGLAISDEGGVSFTFHRGKDWRIKLDGLAKPQCPADNQSNAFYEHLEDKEYADSSFDAQHILEFRRGPATFTRLFDAYLPRCKDSDSRALPQDRGWLYAEMRFLRAMWNMVHAYGDQESHAAMKACCLSLRDDFAAQSDRLAVQWLDQVMAKPGRHPSFFTVTLVPMETESSAK
jgi:hypothetical protein